jgi:hypothetical protein
MGCGSSIEGEGRIDNSRADRQRRMLIQQYDQKAKEYNSSMPVMAASMRAHATQLRSGAPLDTPMVHLTKEEVGMGIATPPVMAQVYHPPIPSHLRRNQIGMIKMLEKQSDAERNPTMKAYYLEWAKVIRNGAPANVQFRGPPAEVMQATMQNICTSSVPSLQHAGNPSATAAVMAQPASSFTKPTTSTMGAPPVYDDDES